MFMLRRNRKQTAAVMAVAASCVSLVVLQGCGDDDDVENCKPQRTNDDGECEECKFGYTPSSNMTMCTANVENCKKYNANDATMCAECHLTFKISNDMMSCDEYVEDCEEYNTDNETCMNCRTGYDKSSDNKTCTATVTNCDEHKADDKCETCDVGYFLESETSCVKGVDFCKTHGDDKDTCAADGCIDGYMVADIVGGAEDQCVENIAGCATFSATDTCATCTDTQKDASKDCLCAATEFVATVNGTADQCVEAEIANCADYVDAMGDKCKMCAQNFVLPTGDNTQCVDVIENCKADKHNDDNTCAECEDGFTLANSNTECTEA